jgi:hypothetical protein
MIFLVIFLWIEALAALWLVRENFFKRDDIELYAQLYKGWKR